MKNLRFFLITTILSLFSLTTLAGDLTSTYICDDCSYSDAVEMARTKHAAPNCIADGLGDNGSVLLGATTFSCPTTSQTLIIADPINRTGFKFEVKAVQIVGRGTAYDITVTIKINIDIILIVLLILRFRLILRLMLTLRL